MSSTLIQTAVQFAEESLDSCLSEMQPLLEKHWQEIASDLSIPLEPDYERYHALEAASALRIYTARTEHVHQDARLIGYAVFFIAPHPHYKSSLQAFGDVLYLDPEFRVGRTAAQLIAISEDKLHALGVQVIRHHVKVAHPALGVLLKRMGYHHLEDNYERRLQ